MLPYANGAVGWPEWPESVGSSGNTLAGYWDLGSGRT